MTDVNNVRAEVKAALQIRKQADTNGVKGLQGNEIELFKSEAKAAGISDNAINTVLGLDLSETAKAAKANGPKKMPPPATSTYAEAIEYFNKNGITTEQRENVAERAKENINEIKELINEKVTEYNNKYPEKDEGFPQLPYDFEEAINAKGAWDDMQTDADVLIQHVIYGSDCLEPTQVNMDKIAEMYARIEEHIGMPLQQFLNTDAAKNMIEKAKDMTNDESTSLSLEEKRTLTKLKQIVVIINQTLNEIRTECMDKITEAKTEAEEALDKDKETLDKFEEGELTINETFKELESWRSEEEFGSSLDEEYRDATGKGGDATGVDNAKADKAEVKGRKVVVGNNVYIQKNGVLYNLNGTPVKH